MDGLSQAIQKMGAAAYQQAPEQPAPEPGSPNPEAQTRPLDEEKGSE
jgi:hypothetical protein